MKGIAFCRPGLPQEGWRRRQSGASAIEFALVFPLLIALIYGGLVYSYVYVLQQAINFAAQQGVQAALAVVPTSNGANDSSNRMRNADLVAKSTLNWLPTAQLSRVTTSASGTCTVPSGTNGFTYQVSFDLAGGGGLFPAITALPFGLGTIPPLPGSLVACAVAFT
jgi:Flp pilus assembly protein TadG